MLLFIVLVAVAWQSTKVSFLIGYHMDRLKEITLNIRKEIQNQLLRL